MDWITKIFDFLKLPTKIITYLACLSGLLLILPKQIIKILQLTDFINEYGKYFGIAFLVFSVYLLFIFIPYTYKKVSKMYKIKKSNKQFYNNVKIILQNLTYPEKCLLREFFLQQKDVIEVPINNTEVISLLNKGIIQYASKNVRSFVFGNFIYIQINMVAKDSFTIDTYGLPNEPTTVANRKKITQERPGFIKSLEMVNKLATGFPN